MTSRLLDFGPFRLDVARRLLWRHEELVSVGPKAIELLAVLVEQPGEVVSKQDLLERVWPDTFVEEANLSVNVSALRKALGAQSGGRPYIETVSRRGYRFVGTPKAAAPAVRTLAVLPFQTEGGIDASVGVGLCDAIIARLGHASELLVRPTSAVLEYATGTHSPEAAGRGLKVDAVLEGRIRRLGDHVRATAQLVGIASGDTLWAETFDQTFTTLFGVEDTVALQVARALTLRLSASDRERIQRRDTRDGEAYQAFLHGRHFWNRLTGPWLEKARVAFEKAISLDPRYARAHAGLADTYTMLALFGLREPQDAWPRAQQAAREAVGLDPGLPDAHISLGYASLFKDWDWDTAARELATAVELSPTSASAREWHALFVAMTGRLAEALGEVQRAQELDPLSLTVSTNVGFQLYLARRSEEEIEQHRKTLELDPEYAVGHWALGLAYSQKGRHADSVTEYQRAVELSGGSGVMVSCLARAHAEAGNPRDARRVLRQMTADRRATASPYQIAAVHAALGDTDATLEWLGKALAVRDHWMVFLKVDPILDRVRDHRRFARLLRLVGFGREGARTVRKR